MDFWLQSYRNNLLKEEKWIYQTKEIIMMQIRASACWKKVMTNPVKIATTAPAVYIVRSTWTILRGAKTPDSICSNIVTDARNSESGAGFCCWKQQKLLFVAWVQFLILSAAETTVKLLERRIQLWMTTGKITMTVNRKWKNRKWNF